jgi:hypothetical protein
VIDDHDEFKRAPSTFTKAPVVKIGAFSHAWNG